ncbi:MAG: FAD-dependent oxidoreductase [Prochlorotrichaceae cyanobacterium]
MSLDRLLASVPGNPLHSLRQVDRLWGEIRRDAAPFPPTWVRVSAEPLIEVEWDVVVGGGTLGIVMAAALQRQGWRVVVVERGMLRGRDQEWNISRSELQVLLELELLTADELEETIASEYNPGRIAFGNSPEFWVRDVLNVGVSPVTLLEKLKAKFLAWGGTLLEQTELRGAIVHPNGVAILTGSRDSAVETPLSSRLFLDCLGHFSPLVKQLRYQRGLHKPDSVCLVVGSCAQGFPQNETGDLFVSFTPIIQGSQFFWEAFPARDGRTTYLFTYGGAHPDRPSLEDLMQQYWQLLPEYQEVDLEQLQIQRVLFGLLPAYRQSPLVPGWDRIFQVGDSSGLQSPLSFGGFGALLRHLSRLSQTLHSALKGDYLDRAALQWINGYQPNLSATWLFQRTMQVGFQQNLPPEQINQLLGSVFQVLAAGGEPVIRPFLQDVVQWLPLSQTLAQTGVRYPATIASVIPQVGLGALLEWSQHYLNLTGYRALLPLSHALEPLFKSLQNDRLRYQFQCWQQTLKYGCGQDYSET